MMCVLGAPGSGKTTVAPFLRTALPSHVVVDWDAFMEPASRLAGCDVRRNPHTWPGYREVVRAVVESIGPFPLVLLGVCAPEELADWPIDAWILLDCSDEQRRHRLGKKLDTAEVDDALADAARYRALGFPVVDTTTMTPQQAAAAVAALIA